MKLLNSLNNAVSKCYLWFDDINMMGILKLDDRSNL